MVGGLFIPATTSGLALGIRGLFIPVTASGLALGIRGTVHSRGCIRCGFGHSGVVRFAVTLGFAISFAGLPLP